MLNNIPNQAAFRKSYSTVTSLIKGSSAWKKATQLSQIFLSEKVVYTVDHVIRMKKLGAHGIRAISGEWFTFFISSRKQFCSVNGQAKSQ